MTPPLTDPGDASTSSSTAAAGAAAAEGLPRQIGDAKSPNASAETATAPPIPTGIPSEEGPPTPQQNSKGEVTETSVPPEGPRAVVPQTAATPPLNLAAVSAPALTPDVVAAPKAAVEPAALPRDSTPADSACATATSGAAALEAATAPAPAASAEPGAAAPPVAATGEASPGSVSTSSDSGPTVFASAPSSAEAQAAAVRSTTAPGPSGPALSAVVHAFNCCRGELCLTDVERVHIEQFLGASGGHWRLVALPESASVVGRKTRKAAVAKRGGTSSVGAPASHTAAQERQRRQSTASHNSLTASYQPDLPKTRSSRLRTLQSLGSEGGGEGTFEESRGGSKGPPSGGVPCSDAADWPRRMQRILLELCKQPVCLPFLPRVSPAEAHYAELARKVYPAVPLSLETVLERLENGCYSRSLEVFNDVYSVFMCAFRYYEPGNQYWMMAQEAALAFGALTAGEPLCNVFAPASASQDQGNQEWNRAGDDVWEATRGSHLKGAAKMGSQKTRSGTNRDFQSQAVFDDSISGSVDHFLDASLSADSESAVCTQLGKLLKGMSRGGRGPTPPPVAAEAPVTVEERQAFQELLTQMNMDAHFQGAFHGGRSGKGSYKLALARSLKRISGSVVEVDREEVYEAWGRGKPVVSLYSKRCSVLACLLSFAL
ncbi:bromodomain-containing protein [Cyclospora cayetanensis]|uniref:Bromodomain-containing protein n=1 Tax=Cyclospora cayetanensis TaxID=88456 RepID=A0A1D3CUU7_9EIME|nr:bromodomain-containing protein [Cyclospora cayetanensis]